MKTIVLGLSVIALICCCSINAEQKLSIDLLKAEINGISLIDNSNDVSELLGQADRVSHSTNGDIEMVYSNLGLSYCPLISINHV
jgi:hypothetical protein